MFEYSSDSLTDYDYLSSYQTSPEKPTPIVLERVSDPNYAFDSIIPTIPNQQQIQSIKTGELPALSTRMGSSSSNSPSSKTQSRSSDQDPDQESPKLPFITNVYIASITIVGLFLLFRMIQK